MTTFITFAPSSTTPFQFQPTLDGTVYNVIIRWNIFGQRWYVNIYTLQNTLVVSLPMIGSPPNYDISLTAGYFQSTLIWRIQNNQFEVRP